MNFIKTSDWHPAALVLKDRLIMELAAGRKVLWLVSGGSNVFASALIMQGLDLKLTENLSILLVDERYGSVGHAESNDFKLTTAGFDQKSATRLMILKNNTSFDATRDYYDEIARTAFTDADIVIAQLGIGPDGHIAGILPHSPATASADFVAAYVAGNYQRLTLTHHALKRIAAGYVLAYGEDKLEALEQLSNHMVPYADQPAQILKELPEAYVFSDQIGQQA